MTPKKPTPSRAKLVKYRKDAREDEDGNCTVCGLAWDYDETKHQCPPGFRTAPSRAKAKRKDVIYKALTIQALQMLNEVFRGGGMSREVFAREYLNGIGAYERRIAREQGIPIPAELLGTPTGGART